MSTPCFLRSVAIYTDRRAISLFFLGFVAGLPFLLIFSSLSIWLNEAGVERGTVTRFSWAALAYSCKFIWSPLIDTLPLPFLTRRLGRRRAWLAAAQCVVIAAICLMALINPADGKALPLMALAAVLLRATPEILAKGQGRWLGSRGLLVGGLFENLAMLTVRGAAQVSGGDVFHLRTKRGEQEVDLIVEGEDGRIVAFEIKLNRAASDRDVRHLLWLREKLGDQVADLVLLNTGEHAYRRPDGVAVVPLALLGS